MKLNSSLKLVRKATNSFTSKTATQNLTLSKPAQPIDLRCEFDVPKFIDLN